MLFLIASDLASGHVDCRAHGKEQNYLSISTNAVSVAEPMCHSSEPLHFPHSLACCRFAK